MHKFDKVSAEIIEAIVNKFGLPTPENVGAEAANNFIVLLIHSTNKAYVHKLSNSLKFKKVPYEKTKLAILKDRMLLYKGKKQCFGTVVETKTSGSGRLITKPLPIKDEENVDKRRKAYGLSPLADYLKASEETFKNFFQNKSKVK